MALRPSGLMLVAAAPLLMGQAPPPRTPTPVPTHRQTTEAVAACGVPAANVHIAYEVELQSDLVRIGDLGGSDEARFRCLRKAVHPHYILDVYSAPQRDSYLAFAASERRREDKVRALAWLRARGKLAAVPHYDPGKGVERFARALEAACSIREGSVLNASPASGLTFRRSFVEQLHLDTSDRYDCLVHMVIASDVDKHGVQLMFVGNEAYQMENQR